MKKLLCGMLAVLSFVLSYADQSGWPVSGHIINKTSRRLWVNMWTVLESENDAMHSLVSPGENHEYSYGHKDPKYDEADVMLEVTIDPWEESTKKPQFTPWKSSVPAKPGSTFVIKDGGGNSMHTFAVEVKKKS